MHFIAWRKCFRFHLVECSSSSSFHHFHHFVCARHSAPSSSVDMPTHRLFSCCKTIDYTLSSLIHSHIPAVPSTNPSALSASLLFKRLTRMSILSCIYINEYVQRMVNVFIPNSAVVWIVFFLLFLVAWPGLSFPLMADENCSSLSGRQLVLYTSFA